MGRIILLGMEEIIGPAKVRTLVDQANLSDPVRPGITGNQGSGIPVDEHNPLQSCLENEYGLAAGRGLALRSGRASFRHLLCEFGKELGLTDLEFRLLPLAGRLRNGSQALAGLFNRFTDQQIKVELEKDHILWNIKPSYEVDRFHLGSPACQFMVGMLQEALYWVSGGKTFQVEEAHCISCGSTACSIRIQKDPIQ